MKTNLAQTPMMMTQARVLSTGTTDNGTIRYDEVDETKRWFNRRFCFLTVIGIAVLLLAMVVIVVIVLLLTQLKAANSNAQNAMSSSKVQLEELTRKLSQPLEQLGPTLERLSNMPGFPMGPSPTTQTPPGVPPISPIVTGPNTTPESPRRSPKARYEWKGCQNLGKCELSGYTKPPLVILSLDGFAREYVDRNIVQTLNHIADCGVKADKVYPSYPSKTFPNHYSIVTGLWPESHGITDNSVFDPTISPVLESMKSTKYEKFFEGEPIWSVYKRKTGKKANCLFWVGCAYNNSGYAPDVAPAYNQELPFRNRIDTVVEWLKLPVDERPGLITAYLHEPDNAGHYQVDEEDVDEKLAEIDENLDYLMSRLSEEKLLECINFAILSDHGMQLIDKTYYFQDYLDLKGLITAKGVVGRVYINDTTISVNDVVDKFRCKIDTVKTNTRSDVPTRKHYSRDPRVGEVLLEGRAGVTFYKSKADDYELSGDHGYDYFNPKMHTIFYARGPSFKQNTTISPYQNIQYMNLWMNLLGIEGAVETNGTIGFFDNILTNPPRRDNPTNVIGECPMIAFPSVLKCSGNVSAETLNQLSVKLTNCAFSPTNIPLYSDNHCFQNYCDNSVIVSRKGNDARRAIIEVLSRDEASNPSNFTFLNAKYQSNCPSHIPTGSLTIRQNSQLSSMVDERIDVPNNFLLKVLDPLQAKSMEYLNKFGKMYVISGTATDINHDGIADSNGSVITHIYRIMLICNSTWLLMNPPLCTDSDSMDTLSFIFPITEQSTIDCMSSDDILLDYTATIFDVERISGFQFGIGALSQNQNTIIRRKISTKLW
ncbi:Ectonucleotide pyrophosphatase/phosphodiesterase C27A7.1 [Caenorhabditis elegans]|uniref:Isoform b of Ectonucleotide pyrophosphatase/phosphodiesterase C27A7.1 n=1 Tax=Caenorhabditis elegans TaxID=6239 RepID=P90754-2|nr:Ectonucleotide pyrophosphatase/phosphodiesterase C27A7.1 [Caenorhabditis elegans]CAJ55253.1 Ectonucleotide pyrophosphatase/phosphodiesterase C27A7.1 [Caenorhabditis elegans]|eukprot:NP_001041086.1 Ectonucleotide pyrophosphatase/phosphodiesterase C27A7.1 [Caenorhabditis elegans]